MSMNRRQFLSRSVAAVVAAPAAAVAARSEASDLWPASTVARPEVLSAQEAWNRRMTDLADFYAGCQWEPEQLDYLRSLEHRPALLNKLRATRLDAPLIPAKEAERAAEATARVMRLMGGA